MPLTGVLGFSFEAAPATETSGSAVKTSGWAAQEEGAAVRSPRPPEGEGSRDGLWKVSAAHHTHLQGP